MTNDLALLLAKDQIAACIHDLFIHTDRKTWPGVRACLADAVQFDMTSLAGGEPQRLTPAQITDAWAAGLAPIEQIHHQAGNLQIAVDGERATAFCYGVALHYRKTRSGDNVRRFVGSYDFGLEKTDGRWRITLFRFNLKFMDGNLTLEASP